MLASNDSKLRRKKKKIGSRNVDGDAGCLPPEVDGFYSKWNFTDGKKKILT